MENSVALTHISQREYVFLVKTKEKAKSKKVAPKNKFIWNYYTIYWDKDIPYH